MVLKNYYKILGVEYSATEGEIKSAYRRLVKKYHPDLNQGDPDAAAKFRNVQEAGETLTDAEKRVEHDYLLESKGIHTGRFDAFDEPQSAEPEPAPPSAAEPVKTEAKPASAPKKPVPPAPKKPRTLAEKAAAAMAKVREAKRATRRAVIISISAGAAIALVLTMLILWWQGVFTPKHTVVLEYGNGAPAVTQKIKDGDPLSDPGTPVREGYQFDGWFDAETGGNKISFPYKPAKPITLYARWSERIVVSFTVTLNYNGATGGTDEKSAFNVNEGGYALGGIPVQLTLSTYDFLGWYNAVTDTLVIGAGAGKAETPWTENLTLIAKWAPATVSFSLEWEFGEKGQPGYENDTLSTTVQFGTQPQLSRGSSGSSPSRNAFLGYALKGDTSKTLLTDADGKFLAPSAFTNDGGKITVILTAIFAPAP